MTAQQKIDEAFQQVGTEVKDTKARVTVLEGQPKIGVLLASDPNPTTPGFWFRETS
jgi:hypothetical protein